jgi:peptidoglycan/LPS O-acetylase OafA/YrhL
MDYELWGAVMAAAVTVIGYAALVASRLYQGRRLRRFENSASAAHLYTFSYGVLAVTLPFVIFDVIPLWYVRVVLACLPLVPMVMAEVVRSRADRLAKQETPPSPQPSEVTQ